MTFATLVRQIFHFLCRCRHSGKFCQGASGSCRGWTRLSVISFVLLPSPPSWGPADSWPNWRHHISLSRAKVSSNDLQKHFVSFERSCTHTGTQRHTALDIHSIMDRISCIHTLSYSSVVNPAIIAEQHRWRGCKTIRIWHMFNYE